MGSSADSDSIDENKPECKEFLIHISGEGSSQIKKMVCPTASDSTKIKLECKELLIDINPARKGRPAATDIIEDILTPKPEPDRKGITSPIEKNGHPIDIPQGMEPARRPKSCIFKVPKKLRDVNEKAYNPKLISIGPLHHGQEELKDMELQKLKYFKEFFNRKQTVNITPKDLADIIREKEENIRHCYAADTSELSSNGFVNMILLDAIFIIELFLRNVAWSKGSKKALYDLVASAVPSVRDESKDAGDYMFSDKWLSYHLRQDLLLLENQLPFFILKKLWEKINCYSSSENQREEQQNAEEDTSCLAKLCKHSNCYSVCSGHQKKEEKNDDATDTCFLAKLWEKCNCCHKKQQKDDPTEKEDTSFLTLAFAYFYELHPEHEQKPSRRNHCTDILRCINKGKEAKDVNQHFTEFYTAQPKEEPEDGEKFKVKHFTDMLRYFFCSQPEQKEADGKCMKQSKKFIDDFRNFFCFSSEDDLEDGGSIKHLYSATQLDEAGVKFKRVKHRPLLDIKFKKNLCLECCPFFNCSWLLNCLPCFICFKFMQPFLEVPTFEVNDETECVFRNLMAFEQCHSQSDPYICNYVLLLDRFINSKEDVGLLVDEKVVVNFLGSNKRVATLVNSLCLEIVEPEKSQYTDLSKRLNKHYGNCWNRHMAKLSRIYFGDFWRGAATVVGLSLLVFSLWNYHRLLIKGKKF